MAENDELIELITDREWEHVNHDLEIMSRLTGEAKRNIDTARKAHRDRAAQREREEETYAGVQQSRREDLQSLARIIAYLELHQDQVTLHVQALRHAHTVMSHAPNGTGIIPASGSGRD
jgi:hypothetical protein